MSEKRKVLKTAGLIGALTLLSRFTGLIRGSVMAAVFGGSRLLDVFFLAFSLVNILRRVLGEGALSSFIVPIMNERREKDGAAAGWRFFNLASNVMTLVALALALAGAVFSREVFMAFGGLGLLEHGETDYFNFGVRLTRIMMPYAIILTLASVMMGACHTLRSFGPPTLGSVMLNLAMIAAGGAAILIRGTSESTAAVWLAWSVLVGVTLRVLIMFPPLWRAGWRWRPEFNLRDPHLRRLLWMMIPGLAAMGISQVNLSVSSFFAAYLGPGIVAYINFANQLIQFPMALTATAAATAMLPQMSQYFLQGRTGELRDMMATTKRLEMSLMMPAMIGLIVLGYPIMELIFQRVNWSAADTRGAYLALIFYAPGLLPLGWNRLLEPLFYARHDRVTPLKAAAASVAVNIALNWIFAFHTNLAQGGLALANTVAAFVNYFVLSWFLGRVLDRPLGDRPRMGETFWKTLAAATAACSAGWLLYALAGRLGYHPAGTAGRAALLLPVLALVAGMYFVLARALAVPDVDQVMHAVTRRLKRKPAKAVQGS